MEALRIDDPQLSVPEQLIDWNVAFPRDPAMVQAEREWIGVKPAMVDGYHPVRLTAEEAIEVSNMLAEASARRRGVLTVAERAARKAGVR
jgi:hypothetical protein